MSNNGHNNQEIEKVIMMVQLVSASDKGDSNPRRYSKMVFNSKICR